MKVFVLGAGKAGSGLARALRKAGWQVTLRAARRGMPRRISADVVILAVRDAAIAQAAEELAGRVCVTAVVLHLAGALGPEILGSLRGRCAGVGQMHPLVAIADRRTDLRGAFAHVAGDRAAVLAARAIARAVGMRAVTVPGLDPAAWHAAGGLVASGAAVLVQAGMEVLIAQGIAPERACKMLGALLRSVAQNVLTLGLPHALTGVVRRGDATRAQAHLRAIGRVSTGHARLYREILAAQLPMALALGEADPAQLSGLSRLVFGRPRAPVGAARQRRGMRKA
jgi:predicted short-subunit dehydrogenase-like oxidoreductase (DUF2520 family)